MEFACGVYLCSDRCLRDCLTVLLEKTSSGAGIGWQYPRLAVREVPLKFRLVVVLSFDNARRICLAHVKRLKHGSGSPADHFSGTINVP